KDMKDLHVNSINLYAKASDYIPEIINQIKGLADKGIGYKIQGGVYYDISKFPEYGKLSRQNLEQLTVHRVDPDPEKRNPGNFVPIQEAIQKVGVEALRVLYASTHYRSPLDYTEDTLVQAASLARRFRRAYDQVQIASGMKSEGKDQTSTLKRQVDEAWTEFFAAMDDDFNTPRALAAYIRIVGIVEEHGKSLGTESAVML